MPEAPTTEPWAGTPPVPHSLRPGAKPEAYMAKIIEGDERLWVPIFEGVASKPVWISPALNMWADVLRADKACIVNRHYHPKPIWAYTISGKWASPFMSVITTGVLTPLPRIVRLMTCLPFADINIVCTPGIRNWSFNITTESIRLSFTS